MVSHIALCCLSVVLLLNLVRAKPQADIQNIKQLLEVDGEAPYYASEEMEGDGKDGHAERSAALETWESGSDGTNSALAGKQSAFLARLLKDVLRTPKRSWSRFKKGGLRSCFGVRLERIGSFSGLGC